MTAFDFTLLDVFTDRPLCGNPLAVVFGARLLSDREMQDVAREFGYSETTFVLPSRRVEAAWRLRSFTPCAEVYGAGHNALGAWWAIAERRQVALEDGTTTVLQELGDRVLPVDIESRGERVTRVAMTQAKPVFGHGVQEPAALARALGLKRHDLDVEGLEARAVSTGAMHLLVPIRSLEAIGRVHVDSARLLEIAKPLRCHGCYTFTLETRDPSAAAHARAFFPGIMASEDPATGSAAGPLGALLVQRGLVKAGDAQVIEQGDELGRPSRIEVRADHDEVVVGGRCVVFAEGRLRVQS
jgi:trans-2,3-dihydro-3-hydroxyanthranilate isomerase